MQCSLNINQHCLKHVLIFSGKLFVIAWIIEGERPLIGQNGQFSMIGRGTSSRASTTKIAHPVIFFAENTRFFLSASENMSKSLILKTPEEPMSLSSFQICLFNALWYFTALDNICHSVCISRRRSSSLSVFSSVRSSLRSQVPRPTCYAMQVSWGTWLIFASPYRGTYYVPVQLYRGRARFHSAQNNNVRTVTQDC